MIRFYDPSLTRLKKNNILPNDFGWFPEKISNDLDFVILGMHAQEKIILSYLELKS